VTIETLRSAGIQVWMLTGDKVETAKCIAISTGLKSKSQEILEIKEATSNDQIYTALREMDRRISKVLLLIDGQSLGIVLND
jgi:phospholipid-translocating ATPase